MRYWVFSEQQLDAALGAYLQRYRVSRGDPDSVDVAVEVGAADAWIRSFLDSPEAHVFKLQGGASYKPDANP